MAVKTTYSEATFKTHLHTRLGELANVLGWTVAGGDYDEVLDDALYIYGETDITNVSGATNTRKLRLLGRVALWRAASQAAAGLYTFSDQAGARRDLGSLIEHTRQNLVDAEYDAMKAGLDPDYQVETLRVRYRHDPYSEFDYDEKPLTP